MMIALFSNVAGLVRDWLSEVDQIDQRPRPDGCKQFEQSQFRLLEKFSKPNIPKRVPSL